MFPSPFARVLRASLLLATAAALAAPVPASAQSSAALAEQSMRVDRVEEQMRQLNGRIDEVTWQLQQIQEMLRRMQEDNEYRLQQLEGGGAPRKRSDASPASPGPVDTASTVTLDGASAGGSTSGVYGDGSSDPIGDLSSGFSIDAPDTVGAPPQVLGNVPADGAAPAAGGGLGGPLDLSAIASGGVYQPPQPPQPIGTVGTAGALPPLDAPVQSGPLPAPPGAAVVDGGFVSPAAPAARAAPSGGDLQVASIDRSNDPQAAYDQAYGHIVSGDYEAAESGFRGFLADHPGSKLAGNAQYWIGESLYSRGSFRDAAEAFLTAYRDYPKSAKAPESLLKLGLSLEKLGEKDAACATYGELAKKYPKTTDALKSRLAQQQAKAGC